MHLDRKSLLFLDTNVFIEHIFIPTSAASMVIRHATNGTFKLGTCEQAVKETESTILLKLKQIPESLDTIIERWTKARTDASLTIFPDSSQENIKAVSQICLASMRHKADIPILAAAISVKPTLILSGNREHFNDIVAKKCGIPIYSCPEFIELLDQR